MHTGPPDCTPTLSAALLSVARLIVLRRAARFAALSQRNPPLPRATAGHTMAFLVEPRPLDLGGNRLIGVLLYPPKPYWSAKPTKEFFPEWSAVR